MPNEMLFNVTVEKLTNGSIAVSVLDHNGKAVDTQTYHRWEDMVPARAFNTPPTTVAKAAFILNCLANNPLAG